MTQFRESTDMKITAAWILIFWLSIVLEHTRPHMIPSAALTVPVIVGCLFWFRSGPGVLLSGTFLILSWLLRPTAFPITAIVTLTLGMYFLTRTEQKSGWSIRRRRQWTAPLLTILAGLFSHAAMTQADTPSAIKSTIISQLPLATSMTIAVLFFLHAADQFGLRKSTVA